jgi:alanyl-tRNA synthetase
MKPAYPELTDRREDIAGVVLSEENNLKEILNTVVPRLEEDLARVKDTGGDIFPGGLIFRYYDEKGLPLDLVEEKAAECGMELDMDGFEKLLEEQKARSRDKSKVAGSIFFEKLSDVDLKTEFLHDKTSAKAKVLGILKSGDMVHIALDITPCYGESGGQVGDRGTITGKGLKAEIRDAKKYEDTIDHVCSIAEGSVKVGDTVTVKIDAVRRERIKKNHTATHLLHSALKKILGEHVSQYGSFVDADRLRFDFTHSAKLDAGELKDVERLVNDLIEEDVLVDTALMGLDEAKVSGATALFGEKYSENVMVRTIGDFSKELCGGTHVDNTSQIGAFKIINESSIAAGVRRIEAFTGEAVWEWLKEDITTVLSEYNAALSGIKRSSKEARDIIKKIEIYLRPILAEANILASRKNSKFSMADVRQWTGDLRPNLKRTIDDLAKEAKMLKKKMRSRRINLLDSDIDDIVSTAKPAGGVKVISKEITDADAGILRTLMDRIKSRVGSAVVVLGSRDGAKASLVCGVTPDLVKRGLKAGDLIKKIAVLVDGSGGGRPDMAQAGGQGPEKLPDALKSVYRIVEEGISR